MIVAVGMDPTPDVDELVDLLGEAQSAHADDWRIYWPYSTVKFIADCGETASSWRWSLPPKTSASMSSEKVW